MRRTGKKWAHILPGILVLSMWMTQGSTAVWAAEIGANTSNTVFAYEKIDDTSIFNCSGLTEIDFPSSLLVIDDWAFSYASGLKEIILPKNLQTLGGHAFSSCEAAEKVYIPKSL